VLEDSVDHPGAVADAQTEQHDGDLGFVYHSALKGYAAELSKGAVEALRRDPRVKYVMPDGKVEAATQTIPTGISRIAATGNAALDIDGVDDIRVNVDVAIVDSGIDYTHPDLNVVARTNCIAADEESNAEECVDNTGTDGAGHGTHTAGTVGAIDNGFGVVGVAPGARLWSVRVLNNKNSGAWSWIIAGVDWVTKHASEIEVVNMSVAGYGPVPALDEAISKSVDNGIVYAVAAGNESINTAAIAPASNPDVIAVSGLADYDGKPGGEKSPTCSSQGADDTSYRYSDWGSIVDIVAPGVCILSTVPGGGYGEKSGTSMAAPHVAGAAAVLASESNPNSRGDVEAIRQELIDTGSLAWGDTSEDAKAEPALYVDDQPITAAEVATGGWASSDGKSATLFGAVNPRGLEATYQFEYGPTTSYDLSAPVSPKKLSSGTQYTTVNESISGLKWGQTYHYRIVATSSSGTAYGQDRTFVASKWAAQKPASGPANPEYEWLEDISCPSQECVAVGSYIGPGGKYAISYRLVSNTWQYTVLPIPPGGIHGYAAGASCSAANACTAVGTYISEGRVVPLAVRWNGTSWQYQMVPLPYSGAPYSQLNDVSCKSASECVAVGYYQNAEGKFVNYSARWNNGEWTNSFPPNPAGTDQSLLESVSCASASSCLAVGWENSGAVSKPVIVAWNGSSWTLQNAARATGTLGGVSCTSTTFCIAAGGAPPAVEAWNGSSWSSQSVEQPEYGGGLADVSCSTASHCTAVGNGWKANRYSALIEVWNGTSWEIQTAPQQPEAAVQLRGVACIGLWGCTSVGDGYEKTRKAEILHRTDVVTTEASEILPGTATLNGKINPGGLSTTYYFEYGATASYGTNVPVPSASAGSGSQAVAVSQTIAELKPLTTYHYRLVGSNTGGTEYGEDRTFTTDTPAYAFRFSFGSKGSGNGQVNYPMGAAVDSSGNVWVVDRDNNRIQKFNSKGEYLGQFGSEGSGDGKFNKPVDIAITAGGDLWVTDSENYRVQKFTSEGKYLTQFGSYGVAENGKFVEPWGVAIGSNGHIWVSDRRYYRIQEFTASGAFVRSVGSYGNGPSQFYLPSGVAIDQEGHVWVADTGNNRVQEVSSTGEYLSQFGTKGTANGQLERPSVLDIAESGEILVAELGTSRVQQFSPSGDYIKQFNLGGISEPTGIVAVPGGTVYVSNTWSNRMEKWQQAIPEAVTQDASEIATKGATLAGTVNPRGVSTSYRFEYGKTTAYGTSVPVPNEGVGSGTTDVAVSRAVNGLEPGTAYHFRIVATNVNGTTYGKDKAFITEAVTASQLSGMAVTEPFDGSTASVADFSANWSALGWASGGTPKGENTTTGWRPVAAYPTVNGASHNATITDTGPGIAAVATMAVNPANASRYFSLWLDMSSPSSTRAGYELRFTEVSTGTYNVTLSKWQGGAQTVLASQSSYAFAKGSSFALVDQGGTVSAWTNTGSGFSQLLSASDAAFGGGKAAVEGAGNITRLTNFKVGSLLSPVANMDAALKDLTLNDSFATNENPLSGGGAWAALAWDNSTSGHNTGRVSGGWGPYDAYPTINGAYWTKATFPDTGAGVGAAATLFANPAIASRYFSLWLDMPTPASARTGYELRFTEASSGVYEVALSKWQAGVKTVLASKASYSLPTGSQFALVDKGETVSVWTSTASEYAQLLSASDSAFNSGYTGIEGSGNITRLKDFRSGPLPPF
jgi:subtilisin family serine protease/sugar lactone lactonase YvrE